MFLMKYHSKNLVCLLFSLFAYSLFICLEPTQAQEDLGDLITDLYKPSVVRITTQDTTEKKHGFGVIVGQRGENLYVVTAKHVVWNTEPGAMQFPVMLHFYHDQATDVKAERLGYTDDFRDLALLRVPMSKNIN